MMNGKVRSIFFAMGCLCFGVLGAVLQMWWVEPFPVKGIRRIEHTPIVRAGEDLQIGLDVFRGKNCPITVTRTINYSDGSRLPITQEIDPNYGPVGTDQYVLRVPISPGAPKGETEMWSRACARCNPIQSAHSSFEVCSKEITDKFQIGDDTKKLPWPEDFRTNKSMDVEPRQSGR